MKRTLFTILTVIIGVGIVAGSALYLWKIQQEPAVLAAKSVPGTVSTPKGDYPKAELELSVYPNPGSVAGPPEGTSILNQKGTWPFWWPSTTLQFPAHTAVTITVHQYDSATPPWNTYWAGVHGTVDGKATFNGTADTGLNPQDVAHTFTIHQYPEDGQDYFFVSVPMKAVDANAKNEANGYPKPQDITFTFVTPDHPGHYVWNCEIPCGQGYQGLGGVMSERGWMSGEVQVV